MPALCRPEKFADRRAHVVWANSPDPSAEPAMDATLESLEARMADPNGPSIAVLPFTNMGGDPEQEYFSDGMAEDIITALSRISAIGRRGSTPMTSCCEPTDWSMSSRPKA